MDAEQEDADPEALSLEVDLEQILWSVIVCALLVFEKFVTLRVIALF